MPSLRHALTTGNHDFPPSSNPNLATQIVNNLSTSNGHSQPEDRGNFEQLLAEILQSGNASSEESSAIENDLDVNYKLITVVTKAGLEVLLRDDPFSRSDQRLSQAKRSLLVIQMTVRRTPEVVFTTNQPLGGEGTAGPSLYLWLLPKLLGMVGVKRLDGLQECLLGLLGTILEAASGASENWERAGEVLAYLKACVAGTFFSRSGFEDVVVRSPSVSYTSC